MRGGGDVDALGFAAGAEVRERDGVGGGRVVFDGLRCGVGAVVEEDGAAAEAVDGPVVDAAFVRVGVGWGEVGGFGVVLNKGKKFSLGGGR